MRGLRMLPLVLLVAACSGADEARDDAGDGTPGDDAASLTTLLSPVRALSIVEIEAGQLASRRADRAEVRQYAATVATDHRALVGILDSVGRAHGATLSETPEAQNLASAVRTAHELTANLTGFDFDATFVRAEIEAQRQLLDRIDQALPEAVHAETQMLLHDIRAMADAHLLRARQLLASLARAPEPEVRVAPRPRPVTLPVFTPTVTDSIQPPVTTGPPVPPPPPITTSG